MKQFGEERLQYILRISRQLAETRHLPRMLEQVVDEAIKLVDAEKGYLILKEADGRMAFRLQRDQNGQDLTDDDSQVSSTILDRVISTGEPVVTNDALKDPRFEKSDSIMILALRSVICVPLISRSEIIGALYVENRSRRTHFTRDHLAPLLLFANQAAVAIDNAAFTSDLEAEVTARTQQLEAALKQLERSWHEAVEANKLRTTFLANMTHDLRSPMAVVLEGLNLLGSGDLGDLAPEQARWVERALTAARHVTTLTEDLGDLARLEISEMTLLPEPTDLATFLHAVYDVAQGLAWSPELNFELAIPPGLPVLMLDPVRVRQVILNLISNARKYTNSGFIRVYAQALPDDEVLIGVADSGEGIPPSQHENIFQRFYQINPDRRRDRGGSGLGLAICRELIERHGGRIWVESEPGQGADFKFTLPAGPLDPAIATLSNRS